MDQINRTSKRIFFEIQKWNAWNYFLLAFFSVLCHFPSQFSFLVYAGVDLLSFPTDPGGWPAKCNWCILRDCKMMIALLKCQWHVACKWIAKQLIMQLDVLLQSFRAGIKLCLKKIKQIEAIPDFRNSLAKYFLIFRRKPDIYSRGS